MGNESDRMPAAFRVARVLLGFLLLGSAALKAADLLAPHALGPAPFFSSLRWEWALIEYEIVLGLWLLSGLYPVAAWSAAVVSFTVFAGATIHLGLIGRPSCGCFGKVEIAPWYALGIDVLALGGLWYARPRSALLLAWRRNFQSSFVRSPAFVLCSLSTILLVGGGLLFWLNAPSASSALLYLREESVTLEPSVSELGTATSGEVKEFQVGIHNHTDRPIRILGGKTDCACASFQNLPADLDPGKSVRVGVLARFGGTGPFEKRFQLYTDQENQPTIVGSFRGVTEVPKE